jgi:hypothetical protein
MKKKPRGLPRGAFNVRSGYFQAGLGKTTCAVARCGGQTTSNSPFCH